MSQLESNIRRNSIISVLSAKYEEKRKSLALEPSKEPKDAYYLLHITSFLLGFMNVLPWMFWAVASTYWMDKLRDTTKDSHTTTGEDRTILQSYFQSLSLVAQTVPSVFFTTFSLFTNITAIKRTTWSLFSLLVLFCVFAIFPKVNTDSWQVGFFVLTMVLLFLNNSLVTTLQMSSIALMAKLPQNYLYYFVLGQNFTVVSHLCYVMSVTVIESISSGTLLYFFLGISLVTVTTAMFMLIQKTKVFKYYNIEDENLEKPKRMTLPEIKSLVKNVWPSLYFITLMLFLTNVISPALQVLVVSENEGDGTAWTSRYFTVVTVFVLFDVFAAFGKFLSRTLIITANNKWWYVCTITLISLFFIPFYMLCNAQPRTLPVIFDRDWEFIGMNMLYSIVIGAMINIAYLSLKTLSNNQEESSYLLVTFWTAIFNTLFCGNAIVAVHFL